MELACSTLWLTLVDSWELAKAVFYLIRFSKHVLCYPDVDFRPQELLKNNSNVGFDTD